MDLVVQIMNNSRLIPMDLEDFQLTISYEPFKTLIIDLRFHFFFLFLLPLLFFSFSLHSFRQVMQHLYHKPMMLRLKGLVVHLVIMFVITLVDLFGSHLYHKRRLMFTFYQISSLKGLVGQLANDFVFILVEASERAPGMMMNGLRQLIIIRSFQKKIIGWLYSIQMRLLLLEIEDDAQRNSAENGESSIYSNGEACLHRLAFDLGYDTIAPVAFQQLPVYLNSPRWQEGLAGLVALAQLNLFWETIPDLISEQVVTVALNLFQHHPYPRVRRAAINAIDELYYKSNWGFQRLCDDRLLPALAEAIYEDREPCVTSAAFYAARHMYRNLDEHLPWSEYLYAPQWQKRLVGLLAIAQNARLQVEILNLEHVMTRVLSSFRYPPHPGVRWAAIDAIGPLCTYVGPAFQLRFQDCVVQTLSPALLNDVQVQDFDQLLLDLFQNSHRPVRLAVMAAIDAILQLPNDGGPDMPVAFHLFVLPALAAAMCAFQYPEVQYDAAVAMINLSRIYPLDTAPYLRLTVATLLELRRREDIASDQTRIHAISSFLETFVELLPHDTLISTLNSLHPEEQAEFWSFLEHEI